MVTIRLKIDEESAEWLAAKIDDANPTLNDVARSILIKVAHDAQEQLGYRLCKCETLGDLAEDPNLPVVFDAQTNEYHLVYETSYGRGQRIIRYCIWCGGRAPASKRDQLFERVDHAEVTRLIALCAHVRTFQDAINVFGPPDFDRAAGLRSTQKNEDGAEECTPSRMISYFGLSETADVKFTQKVGDVVSVSFVGKYIGGNQK